MLLQLLQAQQLLTTYEAAEIRLGVRAFVTELARMGQFLASGTLSLYQPGMVLGSSPIAAPYSSA